MPWFVAGVLTVLAGAPEPARIHLDWDAPPPCPGVSVVHAEVDAMLTEAGHTSDATVEVWGRAAENSDGLWTISLGLTIEGDRSERTIEGASCPELSSVAAFIIATAIDPRVATLPPRPVPDGDETDETIDAPDPEVPSPGAVVEPEPADPVEPEPLEPEAAQPEPVDPNPVESEPDPHPVDELPPRIRLAVGAHGGVGFGPLPRLGGVVGASFGVLGSVWRAELFGEYWTPSEATSPQNDAVGARVQGWDIGARGCWVPAVGRVEFPLCGGLAAGLLHGVGTGDLQITRATAAWVRAMAGPGVLVRLGDRLALGARVDGYGTLATGAFRTQPSGVVHQPRLGGLTATVGIEFRLR